MESYVSGINSYCLCYTTDCSLNVENGTLHEIINAKMGGQFLGLNVEYASAVDFGFGLYDSNSSFLMITYVRQIRNQMNIKNGQLMPQISHCGVVRERYVIPSKTDKIE